MPSSGRSRVCVYFSNTSVPGVADTATPTQDQVGREAPVAERGVPARAINPIHARMRIQAEHPYIEIHLFHLNLYKYAFQCGALISGFISSDWFFNDLKYTKRIALKVKGYFSEPKKEEILSLAELQEEASKGYKSTIKGSVTQIPKEIPKGPPMEGG